MNISTKIPGIQTLRPNHAGSLRLKTGRTINYGVIRVDENQLVYFTGKGLREIWKPNMSEEEKQQAEILKASLEQENGEKKLLESNHIAITPLDEIEQVYF